MEQVHMKEAQCAEEAFKGTSSMEASGLVCL